MSLAIVCVLVTLHLAITESMPVPYQYGAGATLSTEQVMVSTEENYLLFHPSMIVTTWVVTMWEEQVK